MLIDHLVYKAADLAGAVAEVEELLGVRARAGGQHIGLLIVRLSRPLPGGFSAETNTSLSHRHLDLLIDGLRATARQPAHLAGPALTLTDLRQLPQPDTPPGQAV